MDRTGKASDGQSSKGGSSPNGSPRRDFIVGVNPPSPQRDFIVGVNPPSLPSQAGTRDYIGQMDRALNIMPDSSSALSVAGSGSAVNQLSPLTKKRMRHMQAGEGSSGVRRSLAPPLPPPPPPPALVPPPPPPPVPRFRCSICARNFQSAKGLFGHMRTHPDRGWRGAFPPPEFNREEFADLPGQIGAAEENVAERGINENAPAPHYQIPDLNDPAPPEEEE